MRWKLPGRLGALSLVALAVERVHPLLLSPVRLRMYGIVHQHPGISSTRLAAELGISWGTLAYHLTRMERAGLILTRRAGRRRLVFPSQADATDEEDVVLLKEGTSRRIALLVAERPGLDIQAVQAALGITARAAYHNVKRLRDAGLVEGRYPRKYAGLRATPKLYSLLANE